MDNTLSLLGLALRAGRLAAGEEPVGTACARHKAYLVLLAQDAADNTIRRAHQFCQAGNTPCLTIACTKAEVGEALGRATCAMLAVTDVGFAASFARQIAGDDPDSQAAAAALEQKAARAKRRRDDTRKNGKKSSRPGRRPGKPK